MKRILKRLAPALLLAWLMTVPAMAQNRLATIDLRKVFEKYWRREQAEAALKSRGADLDKEYKSLVDEYNKAKEEFSKLVAKANDQSVSAEEREKRKTEADSKRLELQTSENTIRTFEGNARDTLDSQRKRMRDTILGEIRTAITAKAKTSGFTMVVDSAAETVNNTPVILYTNGENDITDNILSQLNAAAPPPTSGDSTKPDEEKKKE